MMNLRTGDIAPSLFLVLFDPISFADDGFDQQEWIAR